MEKNSRTKDQYTMIIKLKFELVCECPEEEAQDLGDDLAAFLQESWFNGEDVLEVQYVGCEDLEDD